MKLLLHIEKWKDWFPDGFYDWSVDNFWCFLWENYSGLIIAVVVEGKKLLLLKQILPYSKGNAIWFFIFQSENELEETIELICSCCLSVKEY